MRKDKDKAFELRKAGKTYGQIEAQLGISRSTLSNWFRDIAWSKSFADAHTGNTRTLESMKRLQLARKEKLDAFYEIALVEAHTTYEAHKHDPLFWAGLMAYAGAGDKGTRHMIRITSSEFHIHTIFIKFAQKYLGVARETVKCGLLIHADHNESLCREMWSNLLGIDRAHFYKTQLFKLQKPKKPLQYGVGMSIITSTVLKKKLLVWLSLAQDEKFEEAVIV